MSIKMTGAVWDTQLPSAEKFILIACADSADDDGVFALNVQVVSAMTGYHWSRVEKLITHLIDKRALRRVDLKHLQIMTVNHG